jgi:hypothetical protein
MALRAVMPSDPKCVMIESRAHEVFECLPIRTNKYVCIRCGVRGTLERLFSQKPEERCNPRASVAELVDASSLSLDGESRAGSIPVARTIQTRLKAT